MTQKITLPRFTSLSAEKQLKLLCAIDHVLKANHPMLTTTLVNSKPIAQPLSAWLEYTKHTPETLAATLDAYRLTIEHPTTLPHVAPCNLSVASTRGSHSYD